MQHGGIYLDIDVISIFPFESLRKHNTVMGIEHDAGLCNAVILSRKTLSLFRSGMINIGPLMQTNGAIIQ